MIISHLVIGASLVLGTLTPAKVSNVSKDAAALPGKRTPYVIYVDAFSVSSAKSKANDDSDSTSSSNSDGDDGGRPRLLGRLRGGDGILARHREEQHEDTLAKLPGTLQKALVKDLNEAVATAAAGDGDESSSHYCWVITGKFTVIDEGKRGMQAGVGFGAGQSQVQVEAKVYVLSDRDTPFLVFDSKGASGHMPGAVMTKNPYVAAAKFVMSKKEPEKESKKIAQSIADEIGKFMDAQGIARKAKGSSASSSSSSTKAGK